MQQVLHSLSNTLNGFFSTCCQNAFPELKERLATKTLNIEVTSTTQKAFGHYQCSSAMKLAKEVQKNPREIAKIILSEIEKNTAPFIEKCEIAGPGFINIWISPSFLASKVDEMLEHEKTFGITVFKKQKILVEFSSPNTAKEMHVGHLRSTIIGDSLARVFEFLGHEVMRLNHIGDWGTSFGMLIAYIKEHAQSAMQDFSTIELQELMAFYKNAKILFDANSDFKKKAQLEVVKLQAGEKEALDIWKIICEISRRAYQQIYDLLDVRLQERGESFYNPMLKMIVDDLEKKGLITLSDGAKCVYLEGFANREGDLLPLMVQKSDGGYNYDTTDMAAIYQRIFEERADRIIYVTDAGQSTHFQMIFSCAKKAGYLDEKKVQVDHVPFGLVLGSDGKKFRTRSGETEKLIDLILAACERAELIIRERNPDWSENEQKAIANTIGIDSIKYADLACHRLSDYTFSYERMLRFDGNSAPFVLYAYVRALGIKRKTNKDISNLIGKHLITLKHPSEISLGLHLAQFPEIIEQVAQDLLPNRLTDYVYGLAEAFNAFFRDCRVEGSEDENSRLLLTEAVARTLKCGLHLLGLSTVERM